ncbi:MAG: hypothetical protein AB7E72_03330 [Lysobacterales bacterium]
MILGKPKGLCYVSYVSETLIHLEGANRHWRAYLRAAGLPVSWWLGGLSYPRRHPGDESGCEAAMVALARLGVCFAEDYKQGMAPADIMRDLLDRGVLREPFVAISWNDQGGGRKRVVYTPDSD